MLYTCIILYLFERLSDLRWHLTHAPVIEVIKARATFLGAKIKQFSELATRT